MVCVHGCMYVCVFVFMYLLHTQNEHSTRKMRTFLGSKDILVCPQYFKGLKM